MRAARRAFCPAPPLAPARAAAPPLLPRVGGALDGAAIIGRMVSRGEGAVLVGRSAELAQLRAAISAAEGGLFQFVLISGETGVGKTRLVRETMRLARERGFSRLSGRGIDLVGPGLPYGPLVEALRPLAAPIAGDAADPVRARIAKAARHVFRGLRGGARPLGHDQAVAFERFANLLEVIAAGSPLVLAVDDLQWADRSTIDVLGYLVQALSSLDPIEPARPTRRILLIAAIREEELESRSVLRLLANAARLPQASIIELGPLSRDDHAALLQAILGQAVGQEQLERVYERSRGNPFLAEQLFAGGAPSPVLPRGLRDVLLAQFALLSPAAQRVAEIVSAAQRIDHQTLARVAGIPEPALLDAVREAMERSILAAEPATARYTFHHPLLAEVVYENLIPGERMKLHGELASALSLAHSADRATAAQVAAEIAEHWLKAGQEARAMPALIRAGRAASRLGAHAEALTHFRRALEQSSGAHHGRAGSGTMQLLASAAAAAEGSGELDEAAGYWERAIRLAERRSDAGQLAGLRGHLADCRMLGGDLPAAMDGWQQALEAVALDAPSVRARLMAKLAGGQIILGQLSDAQRSAQAAIEVAGRIGAAPEEGLARGSLGAALAMQGRAAAGVEHLRRSLTVAIHQRAIEDEAIARSNLAEALHFSGQLVEAIEVLDEGITRVHRAGLDRTYGGTMTATAAYLVFVAGRWDEAMRRCHSGLARLPQGIAAAWLYLVQGEVLTERGQFDEAAESIATAAALSPGDRVTGWDGPHEQLATLAIHRGRPREALRLVRQALGLLSGGELTSKQRFLVALGLRAAANVAQESGSAPDVHGRDEARAVARDLIARLRDHARAIAGDADPHLAAELPLAEAEYRRCLGDDDPERWAAVAAAWDTLQHPLDLCYGKVRRAEALLRHASRRSVRQDVARELEEAWAIAAALGARPATQRIEEIARRGRIVLSAREGRPLERRALPGDPRGLTPREQQVLRLLLDGRTDREIADQLFIAEKTASVHVSNIKAKFAAASRTEVAVRALQLGYATDHS